MTVMSAEDSRSGASKRRLKITLLVGNTWFELLEITLAEADAKKTIIINSVCMRDFTSIA